MKLVIISASQRKESQSAKVAKYIAETAIEYKDIVHFELYKYHLPLWDGEQASKVSNTNDWNIINKDLHNADALILITPEWGGMASPLLKNFLLMCSSQETAHKPVLITSVSSGISGAYPIAELRMNAFKNNKLIAIPEHLIIRQVEEILNTTNDYKDSISTHDQLTRQRIDYSLYSLKNYSTALKGLREKLITQPHQHEEKFSYGM